MAQYLEAPGYCPHCQRRVIGRRQETDHTFWLIASVFSCGLFAIVWFIISLIKESKPFYCAVCGTILQQLPRAVPPRPLPATTQALPRTSPRLLSDAFATPASSKQKALGYVLLVISAIFAVILVSAFIATNALQQSRQKPSPTSQGAPSQIPLPSQTATPKAVLKYRTKAERIKAGVIDIDQPYGFVCYRKLKEDIKIIDDDSIPRKAQVVVYERCIEREGDAETAVREFISVLK